MKSKNPLLNLLHGIKWPKTIIALAITISTLGSIFALLVPLFTGQLVDGLAKKQINISFILIFSIIFLLNIILSGIGIYLLSKFGETLIYSIRLKLWKHIIYLDMPFFESNESGQLMSRLIDDTTVINNFIAIKLSTLFPSLISVVGSIFILFIIDWKMTFLILIIFPIFLITIKPLGNMIQNIAINTQAEIATFSGFLGKILNAIFLIKTSTSEENEINNAEKNLKKIYNLNLKQAKIFSIIQPLSGLVTLITIGVLLVFGGYRVSIGSITSGNLVSMIFYVVQLSNPLMNISSTIAEYKKTIGASQRINEIMSYNKESLSGTIIDSNNSSNLEFIDVNFTYNKKYIFENINLCFPKNKITAIVGPSGAGKSTIFKLIERMYPINSGYIKYGNLNIDTLFLKQWREKIGYVMQDNPMINGTVKENLLYGVEKNVNNEELIECCSLAGCHEFIKDFEDGYNTVIGESGKRLSEGERQRINIARNFIKNPEILLLDEITSNLDSESELKIQKSLNKLVKNKTTIIIAHRLSTIKEADQIIFLDKGKVTGKGSHYNLMKYHNKYRAYVKQQSYH